MIDNLSDISSSDSEDDINYLPVNSTSQEKVKFFCSKSSSKSQLTNSEKSFQQLDKSKLLKYWNRRYDLFERFDSGIQLDYESWYSVTPEPIARHQANVCACDLIADVFCGAGGNAIQFAGTCGLVLAIDNNFPRLILLNHNACVYGVSRKIMSVCGDATRLLNSLRLTTSSSNDVTSNSQNPSSITDQKLPTIIDTIFLSPPWGGPGYSGLVLPPGSSSWNTRKRRQWFSSALEAIETTWNLEELSSFLSALEAARHQCARLLAHLPRNCSVGQVLRLGWPSDDSPSCNHPQCMQKLDVEIEEYWLRGRRMAIGAYIGCFAKS